MSSKTEKIYVLVQPNQAGEFLSHVENIARDNGMTPNRGQATDDKGHTLQVIEAKSWGKRLWVQNLPLSGHEDPKLCGTYTEPHPDPGQYILMVSSHTSLFGGSKVEKFSDQLITDLKSQGFSAEREPHICSEYSKIA